MNDLNKLEELLDLPLTFNPKDSRLVILARLLLKKQELAIKRQRARHKKARAKERFNKKSSRENRLKMHEAEYEYLAAIIKLAKWNKSRAAKKALKLRRDMKLKLIRGHDTGLFYGLAHYEGQGKDRTRDWYAGLYDLKELAKQKS